MLQQLAGLNEVKQGKYSGDTEFGEFLGSHSGDVLFQTGMAVAVWTYTGIAK